MGDQRVIHQVVEHHLEAQAVVGRQQLGGRDHGLALEALADGLGLLLHGLLDLQVEHPGEGQHHPHDEDQAEADQAQSDRHPPTPQGVEQEDEEVVGFDGRGPVHEWGLGSGSDGKRSIAVLSGIGQSTLPDGVLCR
ncbi:hypothetical protein D3C80_1606350 [compost metagenome]